jgi:hypothetical protein
MHPFWRGVRDGLRTKILGPGMTKKIFIALICACVASCITTAIGTIFMIHVGFSVRGFGTVIDTLVGSGMAVGLIVFLVTLYKLGFDLNSN